jgi:methylated-DNA-[protein]-cysteine S-methyltransferase
MSELAWATLSSPVGPLAVGCSPAGVARLDFRSPGGAGRRDAGQASSGQASSGQAAPGLLAAARDQLAEYFAGQRQAFDLPVDWSGCSRAQHQVLSVLYGSVAADQVMLLQGR